MICHVCGDELDESSEMDTPVTCRCCDQRVHHTCASVVPIERLRWQGGPAWSDWACDDCRASGKTRLGSGQLAVGSGAKEVDCPLPNAHCPSLWEWVLLAVIVALLVWAEYARQVIGP